MLNLLCDWLRIVEREYHSKPSNKETIYGSSAKSGDEFGLIPVGQSKEGLGGVYCSARRLAVQS